MSLESLTKWNAKFIKMNKKDLAKENKKPHILCICEHGNVRSVALAYLIKTIYGYDVLACGLIETTYETKEMLFKWADRVFLLDVGLLKLENYKKWVNNKKIELVNVGPDIWHDPYAQELHHKILKQLKNLHL